MPKRGYRLIAAVTPPTRTGVPALAVLPFDTVAGSPVEGFLADGISDAITTELGKLAALRVISRQSTLRFKGARASLGDIARELRVDAVVEGLVQSDGTKLRLSAQLVEVDPERHLWAESYDCNVAENLAVQRTIARRAADAVHAALRPGQVRPTTESSAIQPEAHLSYLEGRHFLAMWTREGVEKGIGCLLRAIQLDARCAPAHEELAVALLLLGWFGHLPLPEAVSRARE